MSPISAQDAWDLTDPNQPDEARQASAQAIMLGIAANDAYWNSRGELEQILARAQGHGVVTRGEDNPTVSGTPTAGTIEGTATEEPATAVEPAPASTAPATTVPAPETATAETPSPTPDNPVEAVATLRRQLTDAGINPEA